jgi:hypothetical protein
VYSVHPVWGEQGRYVRGPLEDLVAKLGKVTLITNKALERRTKG